MQRILEYCLHILPYFLFSFPFLFILRLLYRKRTKKWKRINFYHEAAFYLFAMFLVGLASQTILPRFEIGTAGFQIASVGIGGINLRLFQVFSDTFYEVFTNGNWNYLIINFLGNLVMFMPIGFFPPLLWKKVKLKQAAFLGFCISLLIESLQLLIARGSDVDDLWLNTLGAVMGYAVYKWLSRLVPRWTQKFSQKT
ncbi:VanZ family protein [Marasmitruncus massiliensis]|uniref:VanZ family protein n=1 Tax=Marasmitruncus massiliensis TaxID=1944642 RepID=UPI000C7BB8C2|nr:VanZ family protein [Marasmitruncus massiliensis]